MPTPTRRRRAAATKPGEAPVTLTLPLPPNMANGRLHWRAKERERVSYNQWCDFWRATSRMVPKGEEWRPPSKPLSPVMISAVITLWNPMDDDNAIARLKWSLDWLVANKYIAGDSRKHVRWSALPEQRIDRSPAHVPTVTFTLTPVTSPSASPSSPPPIPEARGGGGGEPQHTTGDLTMTEGFIARELRKIEAAIATEEHGTVRFRELFAAQQALGWVLEPEAFKPPLDSINQVPSRSVSVPPGSDGFPLTTTSHAPLA